MVAVSGDKVDIHIRIPKAVYDELNRQGVKISPLITNILTERYLSTAGNVPAMEQKVAGAKILSLTEIVKETIIECGFSIEEAKMVNGFKPYEIDKVYESVKKRTLTTKQAVFKIMMELLK